eukprot:g40030.t1
MIPVLITLCVKSEFCGAAWWGAGGVGPHDRELTGRFLLGPCLAVWLPLLGIAISPTCCCRKSCVAALSAMFSTNLERDVLDQQSVRERQVGRRTGVLVLEALHDRLP